MEPKQIPMNIFSLNVKGLNQAEKRSQLFRDPTLKKSHIIMLQETHFRTGQIPKLTVKNFPLHFHATNPDSKTKGVSVLLHKDCDFKLEATEVDPLGRYLFVKGSIQETPVTIANLYCPNIAQLTFLTRTLLKLQNFTSGILIVGTDLNCTLNPLLDTSDKKSHLPQTTIRAIQKRLDSLQLVDTWRLTHPDGRDYTFFSNAKNKYSRIDYILVTQRDLDRIIASSIGNIEMSDHAPTSLSLDMSGFYKKNHSWRLNPFLLRDQNTIKEIQTHLNQYFETNDTQETDPMTLWEAHKCTLRGHLISLGARRKKETNKKIDELHQTIRKLENAHKTSLKEATLQQLTQARKELISTLNQYHRRNLALKQGIYYEGGNKCGKILSKALKLKAQLHNIRLIKDNKGKTFQKPEEIVDQFKKYYEALYNLPTPPSATSHNQNMKEYLESSGMPKLSNEAIDTLEKPLTPEEFQLAIKQLKTGKSPGPDGFTALYYRTFGSTLEPFFIKAFETTSATRSLPKTSLEAHIVILPKEGKDPSMCQNYRPISLLNIDVKILAKIIANRMLPLIPPLIGLEQVGFVPGREARDNVIKTLNLHHWARKNDIRTFFVSTDAEKAFDRVAWPWIENILDHLGMGTAFKNKILALYSNPQARIRACGTLSDAFRIQNGTRQGCPLSPLIFALSLEPFIRQIKQDPNISGIQVGEKEFKIAAYADDMIFYITNPHISTPSLMKQFETFGALSFLKINYTKSVAINISLDTQTLTQLKTNFPFEWSPSHLRLLGVNIPSDIDKIFSLNFTPVLTNINKDLQNWRNLPVSWFGRIAIIKSNILPKILYLLQALPIDLPRTFKSSVRKAFSTFIWKDHPPRIKFNSMIQTKKLGGLGVPHIDTYHKATLLTKFIDWSNNQHRKDWVKLETTPPLGLSPTAGWISFKHLPPIITSNPIIAPALKILNQQAKIGILTTIPSPLTPLKGNPEFIPGEQESFLQEWSRDAPPQLKHFCHNNKIASWEEIQNSTPAHVPFWNYVQIRHFIQTIKTHQPVTRKLTDYERACSGQGPKTHILSWTYKLALDMIKDHTNMQRKQKWETLTAQTYSDEAWTHINELAHVSSISSSVQETSFKILSMWYRTPDIIHKIFPTSPNTCWRCQHSVGTLMHIWWDCPRIRGYWSQISSTINQITNTKIPCKPEIFLLHAHPTASKNTLLTHLINAARTILPRKWRSQEPPTLQEWLLQVAHIQEMENIVAIKNESLKTYTEIWEPWAIFAKQNRHSTLM